MSDQQDANLSSEQDKTNPDTQNNILGNEKTLVRQNLKEQAKENINNDVVLQNIIKPPNLDWKGITPSIPITPQEFEIKNKILPTNPNGVTPIKKETVNNIVFDPAKVLRNLKPISEHLRPKKIDHPQNRFMQELKNAQDFRGENIKIEQVLYCYKCEYTENVPIHCFGPMIKFNANTLSCKKCDYQTTFPIHCEDILIFGNEFTAHHQFRIGIHYLKKWDFHKAIEYFNQSLLGFDTEQHKKNITWVNLNTARAYFSLTEINKSSILFKDCLTSFKELDDKLGIAWAYNGLGDIFRLNGDLSAALYNYELSRDLFDLINDKEALAWSFYILGTIYRLKGEHNLALTYNKISLNNFKELANANGEAESLTNIALVYQEQGKNESAYRYLNSSLDIFNEINDKVKIATTIFYLIINSLELRKKGKSKAYFNQLEMINKETSNKEIDLRFRIAKALLKKSSKRLVDIAEAIKILDGIYTEKVINHELTTFASLKLCELLLLELKAFEEEEVLQQIIDITYKLNRFAKEQNNFPLQIQTSLFSANLHLLEGNLDKSDKIIEEVIRVTKQKQLDFLHNKAISLRNKLGVDMNKWNELITKNSSMKDKLDQSQVDSYLKLALSIKADNLDD